ncbi:hypothetical protein GOODEAATRI_010005 [Goodea atripinnis]|uniref:SSD domain-containing protein n=1 Tax=Goodea atripinnis TaxID=208336 RepID=A0ABV0N041_9TELE
MFKDSQQNNYQNNHIKLGQSNLNVKCLDAPWRTVLGRPVLPNGRELTTSTRMTLREQLRETISAAFYRHGLLCASYPVAIILFTSASILTCCYPLLRLPLPGTGPVEFTTGLRDYSIPSHEPQGDLERPDWQVLVKAAVSPWDSSLVPVDVFRSPLGKVFSLLEDIRNHVHSDGLRDDHMVHIHFKEEIGIAELIPLVTTYIILFAYIYFSTRKIDMVKSKWGLALAAVVTVLSSLLMSVGLCTLFGLTPTLNGG